MKDPVIVVLDIGTTNIKCIIFDQSSKIVSSTIKNIRVISPKSGEMEYDPLEVWDTARIVFEESLKRGEIGVENILSLGIATQRGTTLIWNRVTGLPEHNAISWQDLRTVHMCKEFMETKLASIFLESMGDILTPAMSLTKLLWLLENVPDVRKKADDEMIFFGTMDSWILWKLTGGKVHATDNSNSSSTHMINRRSQEWDQRILSFLNIPIGILPLLKPSSGLLGFVDQSILGKEIPIYSLIGDQQASLYGQACFKPGMAKCTYGTGAFVLMNIGEMIIPSARVAWSRDRNVIFKLEGFAPSTGSMMEWLFTEWIESGTIQDSERIALSIENFQDVFVAPAFSGLHTPYNAPFAKGMILGLSTGTKKGHIVKAFLESIGMVCRSIIEDMEVKSGIKVERLRVDGAGSVNNFLLQFQSDILRIPVERTSIVQSTAAGAAYLAGLACGFWSSEEEISDLWKSDRVFEPKMDQTRRDSLYESWKEAVRLCVDWSKK